MLQQKAFRKSNRHSTIWIYSEREILYNKKYTLFPEYGYIV
jgi:hypothetical protein